MSLNRSESSVQRRFDTHLCPPPALDSKFVALNVENWTQRREAFFPHGTVLEISCTSFVPVEKTAFWKCRRGRWQVKGHLPRCPAVNELCNYRVDRSARVQVFHIQTRQFVVFNQQFGIGAKLLFTCTNHFMDQLRGTPVMECMGNNEWSAPIPPYCVPLDPEHKKTEPPPVHFVVEHGSHTVSPDNELVVNSSAVITLYCFYPKTLGQPKWETTSTYRSFPQSWTKGVHSQFMQDDAYSVCQNFFNFIIRTVLAYDNSSSAGRQWSISLCFTRPS